MIEEDWDWWLERLSSDFGTAGYLVETKNGIGRTYHRDKKINGKVPVYLADGRKLLVSEENIIIKGYID